MAKKILSKLTYILQSKAIVQYIDNISNRHTAKEYEGRLRQFEEFCNTNYQFNLDELLLNKLFQIDIYGLLSTFTRYLASKKTLSNLSIKQRLITAKNLLEFYDIDISPRKFKQKVSTPRAVTRKKQALEKEDIVRILEAIPNYKLKTYCLFLAATATRATEAASVRIEDIHFDKGYVHIRGEFTKTKVDRDIFMTTELSRQLQAYLEYKYRTRTRYPKGRKPYVFTPIRKEADLVFTSCFEGGTRYYDIGDKQSIEYIYSTLVTLFNDTLKQLQVPFENSEKKRHVWTFHSFRRWANLGYTAYADYFLGHKNNPYYTKSFEKEKEFFRKHIEQSLTLLDQSFIESKHADTQSKLENVEREYRELKANRRELEERLNRLEMSAKKFVKEKR